MNIMQMYPKRNNSFIFSETFWALEIRKYFCKPFRGQIYLFSLYKSLTIGCSILLSAEEEILLQSVSSQKSPYTRLCHGLADKASLMKAGLLWLPLVLVLHQHPILVRAKTNFSIFTVFPVATFFDLWGEYS